MQTSKVIRAINGDRVTISHPSLDLSHRMTTFATVAYDQSAHMVVSLPSPLARDTGTLVTGLCTVNGHETQIIERMDANNVGQAAVRYEAVLTTENGALQVHSYDSGDHATSLMAALDPQATDLGVIVGPRAQVDWVTDPEVTLEVDNFALLQIHPLSDDVVRQLPDWAGTPVGGGELFAGRMSRSLPYVILVSSTARTNVLPGQRTDIDTAAALAAELTVAWSR